ncbi:MAG: hypothetical protein AB1757_23895 [Acidobacteriota bacterium]
MLLKIPGKQPERYALKKAGSGLNCSSQFKPEPALNFYSMKQCPNY